MASEGSENPKDQNSWKLLVLPISSIISATISSRKTLVNPIISMSFGLLDSQSPLRPESSRNHGNYWFYHVLPIVSMSLVAKSMELLVKPIGSMNFVLLDSRSL